MVITLPGYTSTYDVASRGEQIESLRSRLTGRLVTANDARYDELRQVQDATLDRRPLALVRAANTADAALDASIEAMERSTSPYSIVHFRGLGGALARVGVDETAFAHRDKRYLFAAIGVWLDPAEDPAPHRAWTEALWQQVRPEGDGVYVNFLADDGPSRIRDAYLDATLTRLTEVKRAYDPHNLFTFNQNIRPAHGGQS